MALESGTYIKDLVSTNPPGTDAISQGDDHLRLIKSTIQASFPSNTNSPTVPMETSSYRLTLGQRLQHGQRLELLVH